MTQRLRRRKGQPEKLRSTGRRQSRPGLSRPARHGSTDARLAAGAAAAASLR
eukprot:CAMPEP_0174854028 /NCGR_PEP_ID=MMETSP1114-20130205/29720_1 /TAXON_ID=312471 /ORGANISM="Neobodo designis, Strain CCAP 1951/1" /LENGTH=51 /DNA_ID=CAMNT_0016088701 /DNA_START=1180 /DNA_END=1332 /DNA_ORIENTATION=-